MVDPVSDEVARSRWGIINLVRLAGVAMVVAGIFGREGVLDFPESLTWVLIGVGLVGIFVVPLVLARKWRSPGQ